jgi:hypothetical protein
MLTSYWVTCPRLGCHWSGDLLPRDDRRTWAAAVPTKSIVTFLCPKCDCEFHARVRGDDVVPLQPQEELALPIA